MCATTPVEMTTAIGWAQLSQCQWWWHQSRALTSRSSSQSALSAKPRRKRWLCTPKTWMCRSALKTGITYGKATASSCTLTLVQMEQASPFRRRDPVSRTSVQGLLSSAMGMVDATTTPLPTPTGWPPSTRTACSRNRSHRLWRQETWDRESRDVLSVCVGRQKECWHLVAQEPSQGLEANWFLSREITFWFFEEINFCFFEEYFFLKIPFCFLKRDYFLGLDICTWSKCGKWEGCFVSTSLSCKCWPPILSLEYIWASLEVKFVVHQYYLWNMFGYLLK